MLRKNIFLVVILFIMPFLTGCWDVEEIPRRGISNAVFFDTGNPKKLKMGVALTVPGSQVPPNVGAVQQFEKRNFVISGEGDSLVDAWTQIQSNTERNIFFGQTRVIVISDKVARKNINDLLDFIGRIPLVPPNTNVLITKTDPAKLFDIKNNANDPIGNYVDFYFRSPFKRSLAIPVDLWRVYSVLDKRTGDLYIPIIDQSQNNYKIAGTAVFSRNRMVDELSVDETQTLALIRGTDVGYQTIPLGENKYAAFKNVVSKTQITPKLSSDGTMTFDVKAKIHGVMVENVPRREILLKEKKEIERQAEMLTKRKIEDLIVKLQGLESDPVGFGDKLRIAYPSQWNKIDWHQVYPAAKFFVNTSFTLKETGLFR
ncbi:Ger(x)C family spore germination protein [Phosphitispora fastidiosa]|uniref:Ger(x)C family spore germination protein n=1 Tax=Phosphitispora fastidiosa TaxID=2837202 RepID=UPI001E4D449B|nr:Ger(x)C family spore germination protein [Phosphitispora fastidiosa]MBU7005166.1 spore germination protein KC [Phosphitispora fastidiosa]